MISYGIYLPLSDLLSMIISREDSLPFKMQGKRG